MNTKIGSDFYLIGTKQRYRIIDQNLGGEYFLISFTNLRTNGRYKDYLHVRVTKKELEEKYRLIQ